MLNQKDLIIALKRMKVETGSLVCLGCAYEHNCGVHGCRILRETVSMLEDVRLRPIGDEESILFCTESVGYDAWKRFWGRKRKSGGNLPC